jgi:hypothetical protein
LLVLAHALEHGFPQQVVFRQCAVGDFGLDRRFYPGRFGLVDRLGERRVFADKWIEPLAEMAGFCFGEAAAHLAGVEQLVPFTATHVERGDPAWLRAKLLDEGDDWKRIALAALDLDPAFHPS